jgi:hypothetical protein
MNFRQSMRTLCAAAIIGIAFAGAAPAQQQPSAAALALAKQLADIKGTTNIFDPIIVGVVESTRQTLAMGNPGMTRDIDAAAAQMRNEMTARRADLSQQLVRVYTQFFTEQELRDAVAFYKTPLGKKLLSEEPKVAEASMKAADEWSQKFAAEVAGKLRAELRKKGLNPI